MNNQASLRLLAGPLSEDNIALATLPFTIGRTANNSLSLPSNSVSRQHARISCDPSGVFHIEDCNSSNGIFLNKKKTTSATLKHGDVIAIGDFLFAFAVAKPSPSQHRPPADSLPPLAQEPANAVVTTNDNYSGSLSNSEPDETESPMVGGIGGFSAQADDEPAVANNEQGIPFEGLGLGQMAMPTSTEHENVALPQQHEALTGTTSGRQPPSIIKNLVNRVLAFEWKTKIILLVLIFAIVIHSGVLENIFQYGIDNIIVHGADKARYLVKLLAEKNRYDLAKGNDILIDIDSILNEKGVIQAFIADELGRVRLPTSMQGQILYDRITKDALYRGSLTQNFATTDDILFLGRAGLALELAHPIQIWDETQVAYKTIGVAKLIYSPTAILPNPDDLFRIKMEMFLYLLTGSLFLYFGIAIFTITPIRTLKSEMELLIKESIQEIDVANNPFSELKGVIEGINRIKKKKFRQDSGQGAEVAQGAAGTTDATLELLLQNISDGVMFTNPSGKILRVNGACVNLLSLSKGGGIDMQYTEVINDPDLKQAIGDIAKDLAKVDTAERSVTLGPGEHIVIKASRILSDIGQLEEILYCYRPKS